MGALEGSWAKVVKRVHGAEHTGAVSSHQDHRAYRTGEPRWPKIWAVYEISGAHLSSGWRICSRALGSLGWFAGIRAEMLSAVEEPSASSRASAKSLTVTVQIVCVRLCPPGQGHAALPRPPCIPETSTLLHPHWTVNERAVGLPARDHQTLVQDCYANHKQESATSL